MISFDVENSLFQSSTVDDCVVLKYKENAFSLLLDVVLRNEYLKLVETINEAREIKGIVVINDTDFDEEAGMKVFLNLIGRGDESSSNSNFLIEDTIAKFRDSFGRRMLLNITMSKPQVSGVHGDVTSEYLGFILPYDARFATPETRFIFRNASWGLPVSPGLSYFLPRFIGQGKALDFIHHSKLLTAEEALTLGLITEIVPRDQLQERCQQEVEVLSSQPADLAVTNRALLNPSVSEFQRHLERYYRAIGKLALRL